MLSSGTLPEEFEARVEALQGQGVRLMDLADSSSWPGGLRWRIVLRHGSLTGRGAGQTMSGALRIAEQDLQRTLSLAPTALPSLEDLEL